MWDAQVHQPQSTHTGKRGSPLQENVITHIVDRNHNGEPWRVAQRKMGQLWLEEGMPKEGFAEEVILG